MTKEQKARMEELSKILEYTYCGTEEWKKAYDEYFELSAIEQEEYRAANEKPLKEFYEKNIKGKSGRELDYSPEWEWYSDWYKDVYGVRPRLGLDEIA